MRSIIVLFGLALLLAGCGGRQADMAAADAAAGVSTPAGGPALPAPSTLPKGASSPPNDSDRYREATNYASQVPYHNASSGTFMPQWDPPSQASIDDTAYMAYRFANMTQYTGGYRVLLKWITPPAPENQWVALSNFQRDRWDWFALPGGESFTAPSFAPYVNPAGDMYAVVLVLGKQQAQLKWILAGDNLKPNVALSTDLPFDPLTRLAPLTVNFDASLSTSTGGVIVGYDFDWEGDGVWDVTGDSDGLASHTYTPGAYDATVRAIDNAGISKTYVLSFTAINPGNQGPTAVFTTSMNQGEAPLAVELDPATSIDPDGTIIKYEWDFDNDGEYETSTTTPDVVSHVFGVFGLNFITLRVTDNDLATDVLTHAVQCQTGWRRYVADTGVELYEPLSLAVSDTGAAARPCVAYQDGAALDLLFMKATDPLGASWSSPGHPVPPGSENGYSPSLIMGVDGLPLIAYGRHTPQSTEYELFTVHAQNIFGSVWDAPVAVSPGVSAGAQQSMLLLNSIPSIAFVAGSLEPDLARIMFAQCTDGNGSGWNAPYTVVPNTHGYYFDDLCLGLAGSTLFKRPYISYIRFASGVPDAVTAIKASNTDGTAWGAPVVLGQYPTSTCYTGMIDGNPAVFAGRPHQGGSAFFARAADADGLSYPGGMQQIGGGGFGNFIIWNGKPAVCWYDFEGADLWFATAADAQGLAWNTPYQVDMAGDVGQFCRIVLSNSNPVIVYFDDTNNALKSAYFAQS
jgi:hypothetical protein